MSTGGAQTTTFAPNFVSPQILERATRECAMSPTITTFKPEILPIFSFRVKISKSAWVGCSCQPSPALTTLISKWRASISAAPEQLCLTTIISAFSASMFLPVSARVSPFLTLEVSTATLITSADNLFAATSKDTLVRVEGS